jgi:hypothetical protein
MYHRHSMRRLLLIPLVVLFLFAGAFRETKLREIDSAIDEAIAAKKIPGGVLRIEHGGRVYHRAYGNRALVPAVEAMAEDTIFDLASITKVVATAPSIWLLIQRGKIAIDAPAATYLPEIAMARSRSAICSRTRPDSVRMSISIPNGAATTKGSGSRSPRRRGTVRASFSVTPTSTTSSSARSFVACRANRSTCSRERTSSSRWE